MENFKESASYYDKIYSQKNYRGEVDFIKKIIKKYSTIKVDKILSLGCGTASHDILLAKAGFKVFGIDKSVEMIAFAKQKAVEAKADIEFKTADVTKFKLPQKFDFAMAMFNIVGYMTENKDMESMLKNTVRALKKNALFVFDCWYGPAVLKDRPQDHEKEISIELKRKTNQILDIEKSFINIKFDILENNKTAATEEHIIRFWYLKELEYLLFRNGFEIKKSCNCFNLDSKISEDSWNMFIIAKKK